MANEIQRLTTFMSGTIDFSTSAGSGTINGSPFMDTAAVQAGMDSVWGSGETTVSDAFGGLFDIEFTGATYGNTNIDQMSVTGGSSSGASFSTTQNGGPVAPTAPSGLTAASINADRIRLVWTDNASTESGFYVKQRLNGGGSYTTIATLAANTTSYLVEGLSASTAYDFQVIAYNGTGDSSAAELTATTTASGACKLGISATTSTGKYNVSSGSSFQANVVSFGDSAGGVTPLGSFLRFVDGPPQGATIDTAVLKLKANNAWAGTVCEAIIKVENADAPAAPTTDADARGRTKTTGVAWTAPAFSDGVTYTTSDIASELQTAVSRGGYSGTLQAFIEDNGSDDGVTRSAYGSGATNQPLLEITFRAGTAFQSKRMRSVKFANPFRS